MKIISIILMLFIVPAIGQVSFGFSQNLTEGDPAISIMSPTCPVAANNSTVVQFFCSGGITRYELYADGHLDRATDIDGMELGMTWYIWQSPVGVGEHNITVIGYTTDNRTAIDSIEVDVV